MIDLVVADPSFRIIGVIDVYESLMWERRFYEAGYFKLQANATENNLALLKDGNYLFRADAEEAAIIKHTETTEDASETEIITAEGYFLSYILSGHIIKERLTLSGNIETVMRSLVTSIVMNKDSDDYIPFIRLGKACGVNATVNTTIAYKDLHEALSELSKLSGVGFKLRADLNEGLMYFECYEGRDFSAGQINNPQVIFSPEYDTILSAPTYTVDDTGTVNVVFAYYSGSLGTVIVDYNPKNLKGTDKKTVVVEGQAVTMTAEGGGQVLDRSATIAALTALAKERIVEKTENFSCSASFTGSNEYKKSYDIGDIVTTEYPRWGVSLTQRIHKVIETYDGSGKQIIPEMGEVWPGGKE